MVFYKKRTKLGMIRDILIIVVVLAAALFLVLHLTLDYKPNPLFIKNILTQTIAKKHQEAVHWFQEEQE